MRFQSVQQFSSKSNKNYDESVDYGNESDEKERIEVQQMIDNIKEVRPESEDSCPSEEPDSVEESDEEEKD